MVSGFFPFCILALTHCVARYVLSGSGKQPLKQCLKRDLTGQRLFAENLPRLYFDIFLPVFSTLCKQFGGFLCIFVDEWMKLGKKTRMLVFSALSFRYLCKKIYRNL